MPAQQSPQKHGKLPGRCQPKLDLTRRHTSTASRGSDRRPRRATLAGKKSTYLVKMGGYLSLLEVVRAMVGRETLPGLLPGVDDDGCAASFCVLSGEERLKLLEMLRKTGVVY